LSEFKASPVSEKALRKEWKPKKNPNWGGKGGGYPNGNEERKKGRKAWKRGGY